jgi:hypothetical protein
MSITAVAGDHVWRGAATTLAGAAWARASLRRFTNANTCMWSAPHAPHGARAADPPLRTLAFMAGVPVVWFRYPLLTKAVRISCDRPHASEVHMRTCAGLNQSLPSPTPLTGSGVVSGQRTAQPGRAPSSKGRAGLELLLLQSVRGWSCMAQRPRHPGHVCALAPSRRAGVAAPGAHLVFAAERTLGRLLPAPSWRVNIPGCPHEALDCQAPVRKHPKERAPVTRQPVPGHVGLTQEGLGHALARPCEEA